MSAITDHAIVTKFLDHKDRVPRVEAKCIDRHRQHRRITVKYDFRMSIDDNLRTAAWAMAEELGWDTSATGVLHGAFLPNGTCVFVRSAYLQGDTHE